MNNLDMKNIIVIKDLPSNIIDEAIVILKDNKAKKINNSNRDNNEHINNNIVDEAQKIISEYVDRIEKNKREKFYEKNKMKKYNKLKIITVLFGIAFIISFVLNLIK